MGTKGFAAAAAARGAADALASPARFAPVGRPAEKRSSWSRPSAFRRSCSACSFCAAHRSSPHSASSRQRRRSSSSWSESPLRAESSGSRAGSLHQPATRYEAQSRSTPPGASFSRSSSGSWKAKRLSTAS